MPENLANTMEDALLAVKDAFAQQASILEESFEQQLEAAIAARDETIDRLRADVTRLTAQVAELTDENFALKSGAGKAFANQKSAHEQQRKDIEVMETKSGQARGHELLLREINRSVGKKVRSPARSFFCSSPVGRRSPPSTGRASAIGTPLGYSERKQRRRSLHRPSSWDTEKTTAVGNRGRSPICRSGGIAETGEKGYERSLGRKFFEEARRCLTEQEFDTLLGCLREVNRKRLSKSEAVEVVQALLGSKNRQLVGDLEELVYGYDKVVQ